jgi:hypothetical protein
VLLLPDLLMTELLLPLDLLQMPGLLLMVMRSSLSPPKLLWVPLPSELPPVDAAAAVMLHCSCCDAALNLMLWL